MDERILIGVSPGLDLRVEKECRCEDGYKERFLLCRRWLLELVDGETGEGRVCAICNQLWQSVYLANDEGVGCRVSCDWDLCHTGVSASESWWAVGARHDITTAYELTG